MGYPTFISLLEKALEARLSFFDARHKRSRPMDESALRLFNGFTEGKPNLVVAL